MHHKYRAMSHGLQRTAACQLAKCSPFKITHLNEHAAAGTRMKRRNFTKMMTQQKLLISAAANGRGRFLTLDLWAETHHDPLQQTLHLDAETQANTTEPGFNLRNDSAFSPPLLSANLITPASVFSRTCWTVPTAEGPEPRAFARVPGAPAGKRLYGDLQS